MLCCQQCSTRFAQQYMNWQLLLKHVQNKVAVMKNTSDFHNEEKLNSVAIVREVFDLAIIYRCDVY